MTEKVDAKIELIRVEIKQEMQRTESALLDASRDATKHHLRGRLSGLHSALKIVNEIDERVR